jgi:hypothetical protein
LEQFGHCRAKRRTGRPMAPLSDLAFGRYSGQHEVAVIRIFALTDILGSPDDMKFRLRMTLFDGL